MASYPQLLNNLNGLARSTTGVYIQSPDISNVIYHAKDLPYLNGYGITYSPINYSGST